MRHLLQCIRFWWQYHTVGRCQLCGRLSFNLLKFEHAHEQCWLASK